MSYIASVLFVLSIILPIGTILNGYAIALMWGWFVVPVFGAPALSVAQACGIAVLVSYMTLQYRKQEYENGFDWNPIVYLMLKPGILVATGFVIKQFL